MNNIKQAFEILEKTYQEHKPVYIAALTSWGNDSQVSTDVAWQWRQAYHSDVPFVAVTLGTGISADGYIEFARECGRKAAFDHTIWQSDYGIDWYLKDALDYGFGYTPNKHTLYFRYLKERTIYKVLKHYKALKERADLQITPRDPIKQKALKSARFNRVMFISGAFKQESVKRIVQVTDQKRIGSAVYCNPLCYWSKSDIHKYRVINELPTNPFYDRLNGSGDCYCNWGQFVTLNDLKEKSPKLAQKIASVNDAVIKVHGYGYGEKPSKHATNPLIPEHKLCAPNLCEGCSKPSAKNSDVDSVILQRMEW